MPINAINDVKIENNSLSNETTDISELHSHYSKSLEESGLLLSGNFKRKKLNVKVNLMIQFGLYIEQHFLHTDI